MYIFTPDIPGFLCFFLQPSLSDSDDLEEMEKLRKEHIEALKELKTLQVTSLKSDQMLEDYGETCQV